PASSRPLQAARRLRPSEPAARPPSRQADRPQTARLPVRLRGRHRAIRFAPEVPPARGPGAEAQLLPPRPAAAVRPVPVVQLPPAHQSPATSAALPRPAASLAGPLLWPAVRQEPAVRPAGRREKTEEGFRWAAARGWVWPTPARRSDS